MRQLARTINGQHHGLRLATKPLQKPSKVVLAIEPGVELPTKPRAITWQWHVVILLRKIDDFLDLFRLENALGVVVRRISPQTQLDFRLGAFGELQMKRRLLCHALCNQG